MQRMPHKTASDAFINASRQHATRQMGRDPVKGSLHPDLLLYRRPAQPLGDQSVIVSRAKPLLLPLRKLIPVADNVEFWIAQDVATSVFVEIGL